MADTKGFKNVLARVPHVLPVFTVATAPGTADGMGTAEKGALCFMSNGDAGAAGVFCWTGSAWALLDLGGAPATA